MQCDRPVYGGPQLEGQFERVGLIKPPRPDASFHVGHEDLECLYSHRKVAFVDVLHEHDPVEDSDRSDLVLLDASTLDTVAEIHLPVRVPYGFHGSWVPAGS